MNAINLPRLRRAVPVVGVLLATAVACFWPLFRHPFDLLVGVQRGGTNDLTSLWLPHREYVIQTITRFGQLPFWNPWCAGGSPFLGNFQTGLFYPFNWLFWAVPVRGLMSWNLVGHHLIAAAGAYCLSRRLGTTRLGSSFASVAYGASPILIARTAEGHLPVIGMVAWYPWAFLAYEGLREGRRWSGIVGVLILALGFMAGHLQEFYHLIVVASAFCLFDAIKLFAKGQHREGLWLGLRWGLMGLATLALVAVEVIPLSICFQYVSAEARLQSPMPLSPGPENLYQLIFPFVLGGPALYRGPGTYYWESICYFGLIPAGLAILGTVTSMRPGRPVTRFVAVMLFTFALAFGEWTPLHRLLTAWAPGYGSLRCPGRWLLMTSLAVALLGAFGMDALARPWTGRRGSWNWKRMIPIVLAATALSWLLVLRLYIRGFGLPSNGAGIPPEPPFGRIGEWSALAPVLISLVALGCALAGCVRPGRSKIFAALLLPLGIMELASFSNAIFATLPPESFPRANPLPGLLGNRADGTRVFSNQFAFTDDEAFLGGIAKYQGYEPLPLDRTIRFTSVMLSPEYPLSNLEGFYKLQLKKATRRLFNLWSIRFIVAVDFDELPAWSEGWMPLAPYQVSWTTNPRGPRPRILTCQLWENPEALPRGFVVGTVRTSSGVQSENEALRELDPRNEVLLDRDVLPAGPRQEFTPARLVEDTPNRVVLEVETTRPGYLVLADAWYPGWTAALDEQPAPILHADLAFRGVALPEAGRHRIIFRYFPPGLIAGLAISAATAAGLAAYAVRLIRPRAGRPIGGSVSWRGFATSGGCSAINAREHGHETS